MYTYRELKTIASIRKLLEIGGGEYSLIVEFVQELVVAECDSIIPHCASLLPSSLHVPLATYLRQLSESDFRGVVLLFGPGLSKEEQSSLRPRFQAVAQRLNDFVNGPVQPEDMPPSDVDLFWAWLREQPRRGGAACKRPGCPHDAVTASVFCPIHHYEVIKGRLPPA